MKLTDECCLTIMDHLINSLVEGKADLKKGESVVPTLEEIVSTTRLLVVLMSPTQKVSINIAEDKIFG